MNHRRCLSINDKLQVSDGRDRLASIHLGLHLFTQQPGGLDRYVEGLTRAQLVKGHPTQVVVTQASARCDDEPPPHVHFAGRTDEPIWRRWSQVRRTFADLTSDPSGSSSVVASHFALTAFPLRRYLARMPHVVHFHGPWAAESAAEGAGKFSVFLKRRIERAVFRTADRFICLSDAFAEILCNSSGVDRSRVHVIPGGIDAARFDPPESQQQAQERLGLPTDRPIVLCVRRLVRRMGLEKLIDAASEVRKHHPDVLFLIGGKGPLHQELESRIDVAGLKNHVRLLGFVPDDSLPLAYRAADLSVVPSETLEGFGLITLESLAAGTPVIVSPVGGLPETVRALSSELILPNLSTDALAAHLNMLLCSKRSLPSINQCKQHVRSQFDWPVIAERVMEVYRITRDTRGSHVSSCAVTASVER